MIEPSLFCEELRKNNINFICGVPDSLLKHLISCICDSFEKHTITANEGNALAMAAGYYLATGKPAAIYLQNSGLGNCINPILSLTDDDVYKIPFLMIIGYRGEPNIKDEPQHYKQGLLTLKMLDCIGVEYKILESTSDIKYAINFINKELKPFALVVKKNTFSSYKSVKQVANNKYDMSREEAIVHIAKNLKDYIFISTTGMISRELYEYRNHQSEGHQSDFLTVGSMGHSSSIALAIAMEKPDKKVVILDGDGACLMHMGSLPIIASKKVKNIIHILLNNEAHDSVGGQLTVGNIISFANIAKESGYKYTFHIDTKDKLIGTLNQIKNLQDSCFIEIKVNKGNRADLGRPKESPQENKKKFMEFLSS